MSRRAVRQQGDFFIVEAREWAHHQLERDEIKFCYLTKGNAFRAVHDTKRNLVTHLCQALEATYTRLCLAESKLFRIREQIRNYPFDSLDVLESDELDS